MGPLTWSLIRTVNSTCGADAEKGHMASLSHQALTPKHPLTFNYDFGFLSACMNLEATWYSNYSRAFSVEGTKSLWMFLSHQVTYWALIGLLRHTDKNPVLASKNLESSDKASCCKRQHTMRNVLFDLQRRRNQAGWGWMEQLGKVPYYSTVTRIAGVKFKYTMLESREA